MATSAPSSPSAIAMARPMPREPPVTSAVRPVSLMQQTSDNHRRGRPGFARPRRCLASLDSSTRAVLDSANSPPRRGDDAMAYVIKRYSNRKLYDTQESRYVTLEEIEEMIRGGKEISVVDASSGEDLTSVTLAQIILENERSRRAVLPSAFLHQLVKHGEAWQDFVQRSMRSSLEGLVSSQREMDRVFRDWAARAGWGGITPPAGAAKPAEPGRREAGEPDADRTREEVAKPAER